MEPQSRGTHDTVARARELVLAERFEPAIALLREHLTAHPEDGLGWHRLAGALIGIDDHAAAIEAASRSIAVDPDDAAAHRFRALAYHLLGRDRDSYADAERAVELAPDDHEALTLLAWGALRVDRDATRFRELVQRALSVKPDSRVAQSVARQYPRYQRIRRWDKAAAGQLATFSTAFVLLFGWLAVDTGRSTDARWMTWPGLAALAVFFVSGLLNWSARRVFPAIGLARMAVAVGAAGIITAGAGYGATRAIPTAATLGLTAAAISGALGLPIVSRRLGQRRTRSTRR